jgi:hypothetical protein
MKQLVGILLLCCSVVAQDAPPQHNFLFVVDTSISMAPRKAAAIQLIRELILSGFHDRIADGDSVDIWTFDSRNHIDSFPPKIWNSGRIEQLAEAAAQFLAQSKFQGRSQFEPVANDLQYLVPYPKALLVLLITDADVPLNGIAFDTEINEQISKMRRKMIGSKRPLLVALSSVGGAFTDWRVYHTEEKLILPDLPIRPKREPIVVQHTPPPVAKPEPELPKTPEPEPPLVINFPPGARITAPAIESASAPAVNLSPATPPETREENTPPVDPARVAPKEPPPEIAAPITSLETTSETESVQIAAEDKAIVTNGMSVSTPVVAVNPQEFNPVYFALGGGLLCLLLGAALLLRRGKAREHSSLISKSLRK